MALIFESYFIYRVSQKKIGFRNIAQFLLRGVLAEKVRVSMGAEHTYAMTRCISHIPNLSSPM